MAHTVRITTIESLSHDVLRIITEKPDDISYQPGQACDVAINKPDWENEIRPFTFVSLQDDDHLEFNIKTYTDHKGVTNKLRSLSAGDELLIGDVYGAIHYRGEGLFLAGGAGITPFLAIFNDLEKRNAIGHNSLIFGNKAKKDIFLEERFQKLLGDRYCNILSDEEVEGYAHGFIDTELIEKYRTDEIKYFYLCGPDPMMTAVEKTLLDLGISKEAIVKEE